MGGSEIAHYLLQTMESLSHLEGGDMSDAPFVPPNPKKQFEDEIPKEV
jgi:hypothetical protein